MRSGKVRRLHPIPLNKDGRLLVGNSILFLEIGGNSLYVIIIIHCVIMRFHSGF